MNSILITMRVFLLVLLVLFGGSMAYKLQFPRDHTSRYKGAPIEEQLVHNISHKMQRRFLSKFFFRHFCSMSKGDVERCLAQGCVMCRCSKKCLLPNLAFTCDRNCSGFCSMVDECVANSCIYDYKSESCFNPTDPSINVPNLCMVSDGNPDDCIKQGCMACKCSKKCLPKSMAANCDPGCSAHCQDIDGCREAGCVYNTINNNCYSNKDKTVDLVGICMVSSENPTSCVKQGCHSCKCTKKCVPKPLSTECDPGCTKYCESADECSASDECMYDDSKNECRTNMTAICGKNNGNIERCIDEGCKVCPCTKDCKDPSVAKDECDVGCTGYCNNQTECAAFGCKYDSTTGSCRTGSGLSVFCGNLCGDEYISSDDSYYTPIWKDKIRVLSPSPKSECIGMLPVEQGFKDPPLIKFGFLSPEMEIDIPIRDDADYFIMLFIDELKENRQRTFTVRLNTHVILGSYTTRIVVGKQETVDLLFSVKKNQTTLVMGHPPEELPIENRALKLHLKSDDYMGRAYLNAFCIHYAGKSARIAT